MKKIQLYIHRQARRHALHIDFLRMAAFRFKKELMAFFIGKAQDLRFDGGAVARPDSFDDTICHWGAIDISTNDLMRFFVRIRQIARKLIPRLLLRHKGKTARRIVARLNLHFLIIKRASVYARRRTRLEAHELDTIFLQRTRKPLRRPLFTGSAAVHMLADDDAALEIRACRKYDGLREIRFPRLRRDAAYRTVIE